MNKKLLFVLVAILTLCTVLPAFAAANPNQPLRPMADEEFAMATPNLTTYKSVLFTSSTYEEKSKLSVTECWLEEKVGTNWEFVCDLPAPEKVFTNNNIYSAEVDYSSYIGKGTFRVAATFDADGHSITRYSNTRTFSK